MAGAVAPSRSLPDYWAGHRVVPDLYSVHSVLRGGAEGWRRVRERTYPLNSTGAKSEAALWSAGPMRSAGGAACPEASRAARDSSMVRLSE
jgi:hypothetical protein